MSATSRRQTASAKGQLFLSILDQGLSSGTNMVVTIAIAVLLPRDAFGIFAVAYLAYGLAVAGSAAVISSELVLNRGAERQRLHVISGSLVAAAVLGAVCAATLAVWAFVAGDLRNALLVLAATMPLLLVQDLLRSASSLIHRIELAALSDFIWLALSVSSIVVAHHLYPEGDPAVYVACWAVSGCVSVLMFVPLVKRLPAPDMSRFMRRDFLGYRFVWEYLALRALSQGLTLSLGAMAGVGANAAVRGAATLFGPMTVLITAVASFGPALVLRLDPRRRSRAMTLGAAILAGCAAALTIAFLLVPRGVGEDILGDSWTVAHEMVPPIGVQNIFTAISTVAFLALRVVEPRSTLRLRLVGLILLVPSFFVGYWTAGSVGAVWGLAVGAAAQAVSGLAGCLRETRATGVPFGQSQRRMRRRGGAFGE